MPRRHESYFEDILESIKRIQKYTDGMNSEEFQSDQKTVDAVINNLENIGEAVKNIPENAKQDSDIM